MGALVAAMFTRGDLLVVVPLRVVAAMAPIAAAASLPKGEDPRGPGRTWAGACVLVCLATTLHGALLGSLR